MKLEIAVVDLSGALIAAEEGADRIELCADLEVGGLTPTTALFEACRGPLAGRTEIHPIIRCRPGDFVYSEQEIGTMAEQIASFAARGATGVVFGALEAGGELDLPGARALVNAAHWANPDLEITFHRALDHCRDPLGTLDLLAGLGFTRVLTSGAADRVGEGLDLLGRLVERSAGRVQVMAGGGLTLEDIPALQVAGVDAIHLSARKKPAPASPAGGSESAGICDSAADTATNRALVRSARAASH